MTRIIPVLFLLLLLSGCSRDLKAVYSNENNSPVKQGDAKPFTVHLRRSNRTVQVGSNVSILDALLADGVPVLWDCRRGECGLCPLPVVEAEGGIEHHDHYLTTEEKATDESLCICVSRARGKSLVLDA